MKKVPSLKGQEILRISLGWDRVVVSTTDPGVSERLLRLYSTTARTGKRGRPYRNTYAWSLDAYPHMAVMAIWQGVLGSGSVSGLETLDPHEAIKRRIALADLI